jgi:large subunit ribosomal protein L18
MREKRSKRRKRIRAKIRGTKDRPRLCVFRSNKHIYAQIIDDEKGITLMAASDKGMTDKEIGVKRARLVGEMLAKKALKKKIKKVVFDRSGYRYHGRVKALAEGARKGGLEF